MIPAIYLPPFTPHEASAFWGVNGGIDVLCEESISPNSSLSLFYYLFQQIIVLMKTKSMVANKWLIGGFQAPI